LGQEGQNNGVFSGAKTGHIAKMSKFVTDPALQFYNRVMPVWALGLNHNTAPLDLRGRFAYAVDQIEPTLRSLRDSLVRAPEATLLSTCNRTELYCAGGTGSVGDMDHTLDWLAHSGGVSPALLRSHAYTLHGDQAARHAFRVASGLDSMVLGEPQILGQMKDAVRAADEAGAMGTTLHQLFQRSFAVAKEVRSSTEIGAHSISMAAASVRLAGQLFEDLSEIKILFVGAGEMIDLAATHFAAKKPKLMVIANRTMARGEALASRFGAQVMPLADLPERLHEFDAVISCTASILPIIGLGAVERAVKLRKRRPVFMVDLAVPRDIEPEVKALPDIYLYTVDDLAQVVQTGRDSRQAAVAQAEIIIDNGVQNFMHWLGQRHTVPLIQQLNAQTDEWRAMEIVRAKKLLARGEPIDAVLEALSRGLTQKMMHGTMTELHATDAGSRDAMAQTVSKIFLRGNTPASGISPDEPKER
jgi:glutamyl-tRNA reductase